MLKFLRIICIWICCAFCLLERIQLPAATAAFATPFEYFEDHDQLSYDLDTEQSKAKYDTRLLSEQMLKLEKSTERYESADSHANGIGNSAANSELDDDTESETDADVDDLQPHERAASCHNNGHKFTHGQKVPRIDPCEVCLCMDGEIFCWWELCSKKPGNQIPSEYHTKPQYDTSTVRLNVPSSTSDVTAQPTVDTVKLQQQYPDPCPYGNTFDVSASKHEHLTESSKSKQRQPMQDAAIPSSTTTGGTKPHAHATKSWQKKKTYQQQQKQKHEQQKQHQHKHVHEHAAYYAYPPSSSVSGSKILSFPENLPSVLYHDYRTEEHQHHQHQHHQQHLKHQQKKLQLLRQQQQQQQKRKQQMLQYTHGPRKGGERHTPQYQHGISAGKSAAVSAYASPPSPYTSRDGSNLELSTDWGLVGGDENIYDDTGADSDILPEPPTKKPKMAATVESTEATTSAVELVTTTTTGNMTQLSGLAAGERADVAAAGGIAVGAQAAGHVGVQQSDSFVIGNEKSLKMNAADASSLSLSSKSPTYFTSTATSSAVVNAATPAYPAPNKITDNTAELRQQDVFNRESSEEDQDDAFHRWLTSTEINANNNNNKNNTGSYADYSNNSLELESATPARRTDLLGLAGTKTINATTAAKTINETRALRGGGGGGVGRTNSNGKIDNVYFRSSYNDYSSEYNGSVVNIDILLTTADEQQQAQQQQQQQQHKADLITQSSSNSQQATKDDGAAAATSSANNISSAVLAINGTTALPIAGVQPSSPERQCNVMGTLYKIGDVLPQDTGNCLQCVCIDGSTSDDTPRVTCSPHNCPPLVLPDLFDATGY